jgi:hypothetical protein
MERNIYVNALGQTSLTPRDGYTLATRSVLDCDASPDAFPLSHFEPRYPLSVAANAACLRGEDYYGPERNEIASDFTYDDEYAPITRDDIQR